MGKFTPLFTKDNDTYVVVSSTLLFDTADEAVAGGANAGIGAGYGLTATGGSVALTQPEGDYPGPFLIAAVGNLPVWIVGGPTIDRLLAERNDALSNLPEESPADFGTKTNPATAIEIAAEPLVEAPTLTQGDHVGPEV